MTIDEIEDIVAQVECGDLEFVVRYLGTGSGHVYLQAQAELPNAKGTDIIPCAGRKWLLSQHMTESEIVLTCFKAALTFAEHEVRESFKWRTKRIMNPHIDVDALSEVCDREDARS